MSTERPILFSGPLVRAILDGTKTQTRRLVKSQSISVDGGGNPYVNAGHHDGAEWRVDVPCPYGFADDRLWVRETWRAWALNGAGDLWRVEYAAGGRHRDDYPPETWTPPLVLNPKPPRMELRWAPSIHMPRWASRLALDVVGIRVERLQSISEDDAAAEGMTPCAGRWLVPGTATECRTAKDAFRDAWTAIYGAESWESNPWVWCVSFRRVSP